MLLPVLFPPSVTPPVGELLPGPTVAAPPPIPPTPGSAGLLPGLEDAVAETESEAAVKIAASVDSEDSVDELRRGSDVPGVVAVGEVELEIVSRKTELADWAGRRFRRAK